MSTEQQLADLFDDQAGHAPAPDALLDGALRKVRQRRLRVVGGVAGAALVAAGVVLASGLALSGTSAPVADPTPAGTVPAGKAGSPVAIGGLQADCAYGYSPEVIATTLDFAFDGTVVSIGDPVSQWPDDPDPWDYVGVTFRVNEWFKGGSGQDTITVDALAPGANSIEGTGSPLAYARDTRLLMSGMDRWSGGQPLTYPVAWFGCGGFSRYYSDAVAGSWRAATR